MFICLLAINTTNFLLLSAETLVVINAALFGFSGCLIYFSRKSYVYLITNKVSKIVSNNTKSGNPDTYSISSVMRGYYLYLTLRPFVGLIIGPIIYMLIVTGLITFMKTSITPDTALSRSGKFLVYLLSFFAGHASSDILDYFSKLAKKIAIKENQPIE